MAPIDFEEISPTGYAEVDSEHRCWVEIFNQLEEELSAPKSPGKEGFQAEMLKQILDFTRIHFANEEKLMVAYDYPEAVKHKRMHKEFEQEVYGHYRNVTTGGLLLTSELMQMVRYWFVGHTGSEDVRTFQYILGKMERKKSPEILHFSWGRMEVEGLASGKDFKLWPGGGRPWDWREHGTGHVKGIRLGDVDELVEHGAQVVILTRGVLARLRVPSGIVEYLRKKGIEVVVTTTKTGVKVYNDKARGGSKVAGLFHSTC